MTDEDHRRAKQHYRRVLNSSYASEVQRSDPNLLHRLSLVYDKVNVTGALTTDEQEDLKDVLAAYSDTFSLGLDDLPQAKLPPLHIDLDTDKPLHIKCRPTPFMARDQVFNDIKKLEKAGIIQRVRNNFV